MCNYKWKNLENCSRKVTKKASLTWMIQRVVLCVCRRGKDQDPKWIKIKLEWRKPLMKVFKYTQIKGGMSSKANFQITLFGACSEHGTNVLKNYFQGKINWVLIYVAQKQQQQAPYYVFFGKCI